MMKNLISLAIGLLIVSFLFISAASAQDNPPKVIRGGILNGKAIKLSPPAYPEEAKAAGAGGPVTVDVKIDEEGNVIEAHARSEQKVPGSDPAETRVVHPSLMEAAEKAALEAKFSPTKLSGVPVKIEGSIIFNFVPGGKSGASPIRAINGGILNGKATSMPLPVYPQEALAEGVSGTISVIVEIGESGEVQSVSSTAGHRLLTAAAMDAAKQAQFSPTLLSGNPVRVNGMLVYEFSPDGNVKVAQPVIPKISGGGVLNGRATYLPAPIYPPAATVVGVGGAVSVQVTIDENGMVSSASAVSGHPLLRAAAVDAARKAQFQPTLLSGTAVKVTGVVVYNFTPADK